MTLLIMGILEPGGGFPGEFKGCLAQEAGLTEKESADTFHERYGTSTSPGKGACLANKLLARLLSALGSSLIVVCVGLTRTGGRPGTR